MMNDPHNPGPDDQASYDPGRHEQGRNESSRDDRGHHEQDAPYAQEIYDQRRYAQSLASNGQQPNGPHEPTAEPRLRQYHGAPTPAPMNGPPTGSRPTPPYGALEDVRVSPPPPTQVPSRFATQYSSPQYAAPEQAGLPRGNVGPDQITPWNDEHRGTTSPEQNGAPIRPEYRTQYGSEHASPNPAPPSAPASSYSPRQFEQTGNRGGTPPADQNFDRPLSQSTNLYGSSSYVPRSQTTDQYGVESQRAAVVDPARPDPARPDPTRPDNPPVPSTGNPAVPNSATSTPPRQYANSTPQYSSESSIPQNGSRVSSTPKPSQESSMPADWGPIFGRNPAEEPLSSKAPASSAVPNEPAAPAPAPAAAVDPNAPQSGLQRAVNAVRSALPLVQRLLPLLEGNFANAITALVSSQPAHPASTPAQQVKVDLEPVERGLAELRSSHRDLRGMVQEHGTTMKRVEDHLERVREATDRNTLEQQELVEDLRSVGTRISLFAIIGLVLLAVSMCLNVYFLVQLQHILR